MSREWHFWRRRPMPDINAPIPTESKLAPDEAPQAGVPTMNLLDEYNGK